MITLAFSQFVYFILLQAPFTGGENGMQGIPRTAAVRHDRCAQQFPLLLRGSGYHGRDDLRRSTGSFTRRSGRCCKAIRDNEARVELLGFDPEKFKLIAFTLSAAMAGLAGALKATVFQFATLTDVSWQVSGEVILMTLLGGLRHVDRPDVRRGHRHLHERLSRGLRRMGVDRARVHPAHCHRVLPARLRRRTDGAQGASRPSCGGATRRRRCRSHLRRSKGIGPPCSRRRWFGQNSMSIGSSNGSAGTHRPRRALQNGEIAIMVLADALVGAAQAKHDGLVLDR